ncbi:MAG: hypothetical protein JNM70_15330 [Anaerolineae bacterium]|nr:hypothetical protein [Anaerolineae bacterium]
MPNETLIRHLDSLREQYTQQQKRAVGLQSALKAFPAAQYKAQRALQDYSEQNAGVSVTSAQSLLDGLRLKEEAIDPMMPELRREAKMLATLTGALKDAVAALLTEPADVVKLDKAIGALQAAQVQPITALLPELQQELKVAQDRLGDDFGVKLRERLAAEGLSISSRPPKFELGRFEIEANFSKRFLSVRYGLDLVIPRAPITVEAAVKAYFTATKKITGRKLDAQAWIAQLHEAYSAARQKRSATSTRANIVDCYVEMALLRQGRAFFTEPSKHTFSDYTRAEFIWDFYEVTGRIRATHQKQVVRASVAVRTQAESPAKSMWMVEGDGPYDGRYIGDIEFVSE